MACSACERFGIQQQPNLGALGQQRLPVLPVPQQMNPRTIMLVVGISVAAIALAGWLYYTRKG